MKVTATARTLGPRLTLRRAATEQHPAPVVRLATASVLAALAVAGTGGTAAATPTAPLPGFSWSGTESSSLVGNLDALLLNARQVSRIAGTNGDLRESEVTSNLSTRYTVTPSRCLSAYAPGQAGAYSDASPVQAAFKSVASTRDSETDRLTVWEGVVQFDTKQDSLAFMTSTASAWRSCGGLTVTEAEGGSWDMGQPKVNDERTVVTLEQESSDRSTSCERAMAAYRNVFIDVMYCSPDHSASGKAAAVVNGIAQQAAAPS
ncbi:sensor domain-containing protein [Mycolicibacterium houstonense]|uniref:sensor domain-containing protein n=1 Tax=Mycolicibacterium houstonense TaxID=146021 RepID=UPI0008355453|nr:sensor domain-containing protein [Mycolicibacterium houstonense]